LKQILKGLKEKTTGLKRQDMIDLILQREGLVKGAILDPLSYKDLEYQYNIRDTSKRGMDAYVTLTGLRKHIAWLRDKLKEDQQGGNRRKAVGTRELIDRYTEELKQLERDAKRDEYLINMHNQFKKYGDYRSDRI
jgi:hypothetical protein